MSQTVADLPAFLRDADRGMKDAALAALLAERMAAHPGQTLDVPGVGVVMPFASSGDTPPPTTAAEDAELARRLATRNRSRPLSDFIRRLARPHGA